MPIDFFFLIVLFTTLASANLTIESYHATCAQQPENCEPQGTFPRKLLQVSHSQKQIVSYLMASQQ